MNKKRIIRYINWALKTILYLSLGPVALILRVSNKYKDIWLLSERGVDARDNSFHMCRYIKNEHPEVKIIYIISKESPDINKIDDLIKIIEYKSIRHYLFLWLSDVKISTHIMGYTPDVALFTYLDRLGLLRGKKIFLQHGITKDYIQGITYPNVDLDLFVCGAQPEFDYVKSKYGFPEGVVNYLGLARFDALHDIEIKKQILIMPTWRMWLSSIKDEFQFMKTDYFQKYNELINDSRLLKLLKQYDYTLVFYPHFEMQKYIKAFESSSPNIIIAKLEQFDVQQLLKESELLITDYSSVYFDFAYMGKDIFYYHFDYEKFRDSHYAEGYFDYKKDGFGPIFIERELLIKNIEGFISQKNHKTNYYQQRTNKFFPLKDTNNCKRNYEAIIKTIEKKYDL